MGRSKLDDFEIRDIMIRVSVSKADIAQDNGVSRYLKAMNRVMDERVNKLKYKDLSPIEKKEYIKAYGKPPKK